MREREAAEDEEGERAGGEQEGGFEFLGLLLVGD